MHRFCLWLSCLFACLKACWWFSFITHWVYQKFITLLCFFKCKILFSNEIFSHFFPLLLSRFLILFIFDDGRAIVVYDVIRCPIVFFWTPRSKRKTSEMKQQRKRIRPCLNICQTVEERCPYLLPGDRSPGYNTQYAGEPTFLCNGKWRWWWWFFSPSPIHDCCCFCFPPLYLLDLFVLCVA